MAKRRESLDIGDLIAQHKKAKLKAAPESQQGADRDDKEDAARGSVVHLLARSLNSDPDQDENPHGAIAVAIEQELFSLHGGSSSRAYKTAVRNLVANLKRNEALVARVTSEQLEPAELVRLQPAELATVSQQQQDAKSHDKLLRAATIHDWVETTGEYTCPECKSNACSISESVVRECGKSDTWGAKQHEGKGRLVTCLTCGYKWEANLM